MWWRAGHLPILLQIESASKSIEHIFEPKLLDVLDPGVADVGCVEVAAHYSGLSLATMQETAGGVGEIVDIAGTGGVDVSFEVGARESRRD